MTDKIIWLDGHVTTIDSKEAFRRQYEFVFIENGYTFDIY